MNTRETDMTRRGAMASLTAIGATLAGCSGIMGGDGSGATPAPTPAPTSTPTTTPTVTPNRPAIERQVVQRDKAAITHIRWTVDGEITWPSLTSFDPVDQALLGEWRGDWTFVFRDDGTFEEFGEDFQNRGRYVARDGILYLNYEGDDTIRLSYRVTGGGDPTLELTTDAGDEFRYRQVSAGTDDRGPVQVFEDLIVTQENDPTEEGGDLRTGRSGTGFIVSPDGYLVTNAHVVGADISPEEALYRRLGLISRRAIRENVDEDFDVTEDERRRIIRIVYDKFTGYYAEHSEIAGVSTEVGVLYGTAPPGDDFETRSWSAAVETTGTVREEISGEPSWGRDIAILSVDQSPLPTVPLGSGTDLGTGEKVFVIGYPDLGIDQLFEDRNTTLEPTLTSGVVSARRTLNSGVETIQTDAGINQGNSGGPMYNADGEVVGVATFGPRDVTLQEIQFGLPIEIATGFMGEQGIENRRGELSETFEEGLNAYWRGDCAAAETAMESVLEMWPEHPYAEGFVEDC